jgi:hypothetical protein
MSQFTYETGSTVALRVVIVDEVTPSHNPVSGQAVEAAIRRISDGAWRNFTTDEWDAVAWAEVTAHNKVRLGDGTDGSYEHGWTQDGSEDCYAVRYEVISEGDWLGCVAYDDLRFMDEPSATEVADAVGDHSISMPGSTPVTIDEALQAAWAQGYGRWVLNADNLTITLYAADDTTIVKVFTIDDAEAPTARAPE